MNRKAANLNTLNHPGPREVRVFLCPNQLFGAGRKPREKHGSLRKLQLMAVLSLVLILGAIPAALAQAILYGPETYLRVDGEPIIESRNIPACETAAQYQLKMVNGLEDGSLRISSATVLLNGQQVIGPDDLSQNVAEVAKPVRMNADNTLEVRLAGGPNGRMTVSIECVEECFRVNITSPADQATIHGGDALVSGEAHSGTGEVGVSVNGSPSLVSGDRFAVNRIPLGLGKNTIIAVATNRCGEKAETSIDLHVAEIDSDTLLSVNPESGMAPLEVNLHATALLGRPVKEYRWDMDGDGVTDAFGESLTDLTKTYDQEGLYFPSVTIVDDEGGVIIEKAIINVMSFEVIDTLLREKWAGMQAALAEKNIDAAMAYFSTGAQGMFRENLTMMQEILPRLASDMGELKFVRFVQTGAFYEMTAVQDGRELSFPVEFVRDVDGLWKIHFF